MQYLLLIYESESERSQASEAQMGEIYKEYMTFTQDIVKSGHMRAGDALQPSSTATTVRIRDGKTLTTAGPFAETREHVNRLNERLIAGVDELGGRIVTPRAVERRGALVCIASTDSPALIAALWYLTAPRPRFGQAARLPLYSRHREKHFPRSFPGREERSRTLIPSALRRGSNHPARQRAFAFKTIAGARRRNPG